MFCLNYYDNCLKATLNSTVVFQQTLSIFFTVETSQRLLATIVSMDINRQDQSDTSSDIYYMYLWFWSNKYGKLIVTVMCIKDYDLGMAVTSDFYNQTDRRRQPYPTNQHNQIILILQDHIAVWLNVLVLIYWCWYSLFI